MKRVRVYGTLLVIAAAVAGIGFVPLPSHVYCPLEVQARHARMVYVEVDGILEEVLVHPGDHVEEGQLLARLRNIDVNMAIAELSGQREVYAAQLQGLQRVSRDDRRASAEVGPVSEALAAVNDQLAKREDDRQKLQLTAPRAGTVFPPPLVEKQGEETTHLPTWHGSPLEPENMGATLLHGNKLCQIGDPNRFEARLVIDQGDVDLLANETGQRVEIMLNQSAEIIYVSKIEKVSTEDMKVSPTRLSSLRGGVLPTQMDPGGVPRPLSPAFDAIVPLPEDDPHGLLRVGLVGRAKITTRRQTLWERIYRYAARTFNFEL